VFFVIGLLYFAILPGLKEKSLAVTLKKAAAYGFLTYMTYELTNYAVIEGWPLGIVFIDITWGAVLATLTALASFKALDYLKW